MLTRWGILSTANINRHVLEGARLADGIEVVAVASRDSARAEAYAHKNGIPRAHGSYDALLADDGVDAVYIPLPNSLHHEWTLRALAAGKHVLCEKPYTRHSAEVDGSVRPRGPQRASSCRRRSCGVTTRRRRVFVELLPEIGELQTIRATFGVRLRARDATST